MRMCGTQPGKNGLCTSPAPTMHTMAIPHKSKAACCVKAAVTGSTHEGPANGAGACRPKHCAHGPLPTGPCTRVGPCMRRLQGVHRRHHCRHACGPPPGAPGPPWVVPSTQWLRSIKAANGASSARGRGRWGMGASDTLRQSFLQAQGRWQHTAGNSNNARINDDMLWPKPWPPCGARRHSWCRRCNASRHGLKGGRWHHAHLNVHDMPAKRRRGARGEKCVPATRDCVGQLLAGANHNKAGRRQRQAACTAGQDVWPTGLAFQAVRPDQLNATGSQAAKRAETMQSSRVLAACGKRCLTAAWKWHT